MKPTTVDECMQVLTEILSSQQQAELLRISKDDLIKYHHGLGCLMRNNWDLWSGGLLRDYLRSLGFQHADDMSQALIEEYWNRLNNQPSELLQRAQDSTDYWKKEEGAVV